MDTFWARLVHYKDQQEIRKFG